MKKRIIAFLLSALLLFTCLPFTTVAANTATVVAENYSASAGSYAYVYLRADNFVNVGVLDIELYYDSSVMSINYVSNGTFFNSASVSTNTDTSGMVKISAMSVKGLTSTASSYNNRMMTVCFKVKADCPVGDYPIIVTVGDAYDSELNPTSISGVNGVVTVKEAAAQNFPVYATLSSSSVQEGDNFTLQAYHSSSSSYKFASADFNIEYDRELLKINSIELDSKLLNNGAVYSINSSNPGMAIITYASTNAVACDNLFKITFEVIGNVETKTDIKIVASDVYNDELIMYAPYTVTSTATIKEKIATPDYPDLKLETEEFIVGKQSDIDVILEGGSQVAAGDFVISYDKNVFSVDSVTAEENALSSGALIVINNNFNEGQIRFSYIQQNGDFSDDALILKITVTPIIVPDSHHVITTSGTGVCDINFNDITLDYISSTNCIFAPVIINPTCDEEGYTLYSCSCGQSYVDNIVPALGHSYGDWIIDKFETCGATGIKHEECTLCGQKRNENTIIEATGNHTYEWVVDKSENCGVDGSKHEECTVCHVTQNEGTVIPATGNHTYDNVCDTICNVCEFKRTVPHDYEWIIDKSATCGEDGIKHEECTLCHKKRNENTIIDATGNHTYEWIVDKSETCGVDGSKHEECTVCHATKNEGTVIPATDNHTYDNDRDAECNNCGHIKFILGDINGDGSIDVADLAMLKKVIVGFIPIDDPIVVNPNVDDNEGFPNASDLAQLKKIIAGLV